MTYIYSREKPVKSNAVFFTEEERIPHCLFCPKEDILICAKERLCGLGVDRTALQYYYKLIRYRNDSIKTKNQKWLEKIKKRATIKNINIESFR